MAGTYFEPGYIEEDYYEEVRMAVTPMPPPPLLSDAPPVFIEKSHTYLQALVRFALELEAVTTAMNNNATNSVSVTSHAIASTGSKTFIVETGKGYLPGQTIKSASTVDGTVWMQGDVTAYDPTTGELSITMNAAQGSGTLSAWTLTLATSIANPTGALTNDFAVKSLTHAIGANIASASTIDLSAATGNLVHITGNNPILAATMTAGKDVWAVIDGTPQFTYDATNLRLNSGGANITGAAGDIALFTYDGTTVRVAYFKANGKAIVETAPPAGAPVGSCLIHFGSSAPTNYLVCPTTQTNLNRATYSALFAAIGTAWGSGDSSTTFGMPWFPPNYTMIQSNSNVGTQTVGQNLAHTHEIEGMASTGLDPAGAGIRVGTGTNISTGSSGGSANLAAGSRVLICVKYQL